MAWPNDNRSTWRSEPAWWQPSGWRIPYSWRDWRPRWWMVVLVVLLLIGIVAAVFVDGAYSRQAVPDLAAMRAGQSSGLEQATIVYTADGAELTRYYRENRTWVGYENISPHIRNALVATEDHRFYKHSGVDVRRFVSSYIKTLQGDRQGGSTISMQLARNYFPDIGQASAYKRKFHEVIAARKMEKAYEKEEIMEMYLNTVPFGYNAFGIEAAARTFFGKTAHQVDVLEAATLIGMLKATTRYNPVRNPDLAKARRNVVLGQMTRNDYLGAASLDKLRQEPVVTDLHRESISTSLAPHFAEYVRQWFGDWARSNGYDPYADGLRVYTTLDSRLQALAQAAVDDQMVGLQAVVDYEWSRASPPSLGDRTAPYLKQEQEGRFQPFSFFWTDQREIVDDHIRRTPHFRQLAAQMPPDTALARLRGRATFLDSLRQDLTRLEVGLMSLEPGTGRVRAWVGGRDFNVDQYDHVGLARRQPGSTFKPFVYAAALERGFEPDDRVRDAVQSYKVKGSNKTWTPRNSGGASGEMLTLRQGLMYSKNTVTAHLMAEIGPSWVAHIARKMGIQSPLDEVPSLALGTSDVTLLELVGAYTPFVQEGTYQKPVIVNRIEDRNGLVIATFESKAHDAIPRFTAYEVLDMLRSVVDQGTAVRLRSQYGITADVAGKTGTTQNNADGWFMLMHPQLITGTWVGFNDRRVTFRSNFWGQGAHNAMYVAGTFFRSALDAGMVSSEAQFAGPRSYQPGSLSIPVTEPLEDGGFDVRMPSGTSQEQDVESALRNALKPSSDSTGTSASDSTGGTPRITPQPRATPSARTRVPDLDSIQHAPARSQPRDAEEMLRRQIQSPKPPPADSLDVR